MILLAAPMVPRPSWGIDPSRLTGEWKGMRRGFEVAWRFDDDGRMRLDDRGATWSVQQDTLIVDLDPLGSSGTAERAVYRILLSTPGSSPRRLFVRGFDLGVAGLLLTQETPLPHAAPDDER